MTCFAVFAAVLFFGAAEAGTRDVADVPLAVPDGITVVDVSGRGSVRGRVLWRRLGDEHGDPVYTYDLDGNSGTSHCYGECSKEFPPVLAPRGAASLNDWTLIDRPEGKQWAYRGQPIYSYAASQPVVTQPEGGNSPGIATRIDPSGTGLSPKAGWKQVVFDPASELEVPADIHIESLEAANGYAFVVAPTGMPLYILKGEPESGSPWTPFYASSLELPMGDFAILRRFDGTHQWAYKGQRLYTFDGDYSGSDINGSKQASARIALAYRFFMPHELAINVFSARPPMMTTAKGFAVYTQARYHIQYGGRETRGGYFYTYDDAKALGTRGCLAECTRAWHPVLAPANAHSSGFFEILTRSDGARQWAYKGAALYTYVGDRVPGDILGNNQVVVVYGDAHDRITAASGVGFSANEVGSDASALMRLAGGKALNPHTDFGPFGAGFYWHLAPL